MGHEAKLIIRHLEEGNSSVRRQDVFKTLRNFTWIEISKDYYPKLPKTKIKK
jgi:hypothetical protein